MPPKTQKKTGAAARRSGEWVVAPRVALDEEEAARAREGVEGRALTAGAGRQEERRESPGARGRGSQEEEEGRRRVEEQGERSTSLQGRRREWRRERSRSGEAGREARGRSRSPMRRSPGRGGRSRSPARRNRSRSPARRSRSRSMIRRDRSPNRRNRSPVGRVRSRSPVGRVRSSGRRDRSPAAREREMERREARTRRTYSRSPRRARGSRRSRSRESKRRSRSGDRRVRSKSPVKVGDLREKLKEEAHKKEMADLKRQFKILQDSNKDDFNHLKFALAGGGNEQQMRFVREVKQTMIYDLKAVLAQEFSEKIPPSFTDIVDKGEQMMNFRMKIIAFAEESTYGWKAANEFAILLKSSNDMDLKKQEEAEKRASKKIEGAKKEKWKKTGGFERAGDRGRRSGSRETGGGRRSRSKSPVR